MRASRRIPITPICQRVPGTPHDWLLHEDWWLDLDAIARRFPQIRGSLSFRGKALLIHRGFVWDGGSIPSCLWGMFLGDEQTYPCAYCCHDGLYVSQWFERETADDLLYYMIKLEGGWWIQRHVIYRAVRDVGNIVAWSRHSRRDILLARHQVELVDLRLMPYRFAFASP